MRKIDTRQFVRATRSTSRDINRQIVLNLVREHQPVSRADLARRMQIGRGMVTALVDELLAEAAIFEGDAAEAPRGRRPKMLYVRTRDRFVIGVDVRFSRTFLMLSDFSGVPLFRLSYDTVTDPTTFVVGLAEHVRALLAQVPDTVRCEGIGLVVPGMIDQETGRVLFAPQLGWRDVALREPLALATGLPVSIENASIACALATMWLGTRGHESPADFVYVTVSDGVGAGIVVNGEVVRGASHSAGEFGHSPLSLEGPRCLCGSQGCLEAYTSNLATISRYLGRPLSADGTRQDLRDSGLTIEELVARAHVGDRQARASLEETARYLGAGLAAVVNALNPAQIVLGGEIVAAWSDIEPVLRAAFTTRVLTAQSASTIIVPDLTAAPRLRGAAALVAAPIYAAPRLA
jgi:predicted NBD/HSP70 family sugar kinase